MDNLFFSFSFHFYFVRGYILLPPESCTVEGDGFPMFERTDRGRPLAFFSFSLSLATYPSALSRDQNK